MPVPVDFTDGFWLAFRSPADEVYELGGAEPVERGCRPRWARYAAAIA